jgi:hypothetical protein
MNVSVLAGVADQPLPGQDARPPSHRCRARTCCGARTTAELLIALLPDWDLSREADAVTAYLELVAKARGQ